MLTSFGASNISEPVGSVAPKVEIKDKVGIFLGKLSESLALLCPAQSYPVPLYRYIITKNNRFNIKLRF